MLIISETFARFTPVAAVFALPWMRRQYQRMAKWIDGMAGVLFAGFGIHLILSAEGGGLLVICRPGSTRFLTYYYTLGSLRAGRTATHCAADGRLALVQAARLTGDLPSGQYSLPHVLLYARIAAC